MSDIKPDAPLERLLGHFRIDYEKAEKWNMAGAQRMSYPEEPLVGIKLRDLLVRGIEPERIGWCQVSKTFFVFVRN